MQRQRIFITYATLFGYVFYFSQRLIHVINKDLREYYFLKDSKKLYRPHFMLINVTDLNHTIDIILCGTLIDDHVRVHFD